MRRLAILQVIALALCCVAIVPAYGDEIIPSDAQRLLDRAARVRVSCKQFVSIMHTGQKQHRLHTVPGP